MIRTAIARQTSNGTAAAPALEIIPGTKGFFLREMMITMAAATASVYGLGWPTVKGVTPTSPVANMVENGGNPVANNGPFNATGSTQTAIAWGGSAPTVPPQFLRRHDFPATIGAGLPEPWRFLNLWVPPTSSLVLWNIGTNGIVDVWIAVDEQ
jgi:hypothetical protein